MPLLNALGVATVALDAALGDWELTGSAIETANLRGYKWLNDRHFTVQHGWTDAVGPGDVISVSSGHAAAADGPSNGTAAGTLGDTGDGSDVPCEDCVPAWAHECAARPEFARTPLLM